MRLLRVRLFALGPLILAAMLIGCAASDKGQKSVQRPVPSPAVLPAAQQGGNLWQGNTRQTDESISAIGSLLPPQPPSASANSPIRLASFTAESLPKENAPAPAEIVPAPNERPFENDRPTLPLDLSTALGMTQGQNPRVAFAQAQISQAFAHYDAAQVLWLPSLRGGMNYNKHEGRIQQVEGNNIETSRGGAYGGLGASAVGAGSPAVPGVYMRFQLSDAIFQPRIAGYALQARQQLGTAVANDQLLATALAYLQLLEAMQRKAIATETLENGESLANLTREFARTGAGNEADADRAAAAVALFRNDAVRAEEAVEIASARLAQQLSLDPTVMIVPQEPTVVPIDLLPLENVAKTELVATGLSNRPELAANRALVDEAVARLTREQHAPWLPSVLLGASYGAFAAGTGGQITNGGDRFDFDAVAWWEIRNLGAGERSARDAARAQIQQARARELETMDLVAREIVEAYTEAEDRRPIKIAEAGIISARRSYERNLERIRNTQGLPIEVLQSIQALDAARREYLRAVVEYNTAQFRLQRALGWPVSS